MEINQEHIGKCVRVAIATQDAKTGELARSMHVSESMIRLYKRGQIYDVRTLWKLATILGYKSLDAFLQLEKESV